MSAERLSAILSAEAHRVDSGKDRSVGDVNKTELLDRCARSGEERMLLARVLDKLERISR